MELIQENLHTKKLLAGASLLQLYTGFVYRGPSTAKNIKKELIEILKAEGINNIKDAIGKKYIINQYFQKKENILI